MRKFFLFAHDPGGGQAVAKVAEHLRQEKSCLLEVFAAGPSLDLFQRSGLLVKLLDSGIRQALIASSPDAVFTGTSLTSSYGRVLIREAQNLGIPAMTIIDYWSNYRLRFGEKDDLVFPDIICSIDRVMTEEMIADGLPADRIIETGHPSFDNLVQVQSPYGMNLRAKTRRAWQAMDDDFVVLYASQPVASFYGDRPSHLKYVGFTEFEVTEIILGCLQNLAANYRKLRLILRPHPKEDHRYYETIASVPHQIRIAMDTVENQYASILGADAVVGISSIILMEAAIMGRVAVSIQPNLLGPEKLKSNISGLTFAAYSTEEARKLLTRVVTELDDMESELIVRRKDLLNQGQATVRVARLLFELAKMRKGR